MLNRIRRDPLSTACAVSVIVVLLCAKASVTQLIITGIAFGIIGTLLILLSFLSIGRKLRPIRKSFVFSILFALITLWSCYYTGHVRNTLPRELVTKEAECVINGYAIEEGNNSLYGNTKVAVTAVNGEECSFRLLLLRTHLTSPDPYRYFTAKISFDIDKLPNNSYADENIVCCASVTELTLQDNYVQTPAAFMYRVSANIKKQMDGNLNSDSAAMANALLLGQSEALPDTLIRDFRTLGISHTLAVSGMHLTVLLTGVLLLLGKLRVKKVPRMLIAIAVILLYSGICGFTPSILRAALMSICLLVSHTAGERAIGIRSLLLSVTAILIIQPYLIFSLSLQLSALSTLGILLLYPLLYKQASSKKSLLYRFGKFLFAQYILTLSATVFTLPVMYYHFGSVSLISPLGNIVFVPLITALLYLLPVFYFVTFLPFLPRAIGGIIEFICAVIKQIGTLGKYCKDLYCPIPPIILILIALILLMIPILRRLRVKHAIGISILALSLSLWISLPFSLIGNAELSYGYDGKRDTLLMKDANSVLLIETGNASGQSAYTALSQTAKTLNETGIDYLLLTHYHNITPAFVRYLSENTYLETIYLPKPANEEESSLASSISQIAAKQNTQTVFFEQEEVISVSGFALKVHTELLSRSEHPAQAIEIRYENSRVLAADPAIFELDGIGAIDLSGVDHLLFLSSPPIDKYPLPSFPGQQKVNAVYTASAQFSVIGCRFGRYTILSPDDPQIIICF
ncbi:MAG: hypothetical protein E7616_02450 [Ruminococcaceae bacterium]|nr:hypothetical protein [Oscillospiraceae bacterium]